MGCTSSTDTGQSLLAKNLTPEMRDNILQIIENDSVRELADLDHNFNFPVEAQISEEGLHWTAFHYCCKKNALQCLNYLLRKCYYQSHTLFPNLVNFRTKEGYTLLHVCVMSGADSCFSLLFRYGGLNLTLTDNAYKTIFDFASDYKRTNIKNLFSKLAEKNIKYIPWSPAKLEITTNFDELNDIQFAQKQFQRIFKQISIAKKIQESAEEIRLMTQKIQAEKERQELRKIIAKKQSQVADGFGKIKNKISSFLQAKPTININDQQILDKLKKKQAQIENLNQEIKNYKERVFFTNIQEEISKKVNKSQNDIKQNFIKFRNFVLEPQSKSSSNPPIQQNVVLQPPKQVQNAPVESIGVSNFAQLPQNIKGLYDKAKKQKIFNDPQFPHTDASLGPAPKIKQLACQIAWYRPSQFLNTSYKLFDGIDPNDIKQGQLGDCYCLATISELSQTPKYIQSMFPFYDLNLGFYVIKFYTNGKLTYTVVDDFIPCNKKSKEPLFSKPIGKQIWVQLIQKAWSKKLGSYFAAESMTPNLCMEDLSGSPSYGAWFKDKANKTKQIIQCSKKNYTIVLTTGQEKMEGIVNGHAYSLLDVFDDKGTNIYKLRNPWGNFEWNGAYGAKSNKWTPELKSRCQSDDKDDGIFFMTESELLRAFVFYSISLRQFANKYNYVQFQSKPQEDLYYTFSLGKDSNMSLRITQPFDRMINDKSYKYSPVVFEMGKIQKNGKVTYLFEGDDQCLWGDKSVFIREDDIYAKYQKGDYFIRIKAKWNNPSKYNKAVFSIYSPQDVKIKALSKSDGQKLWKAFLIDFMKNEQLNELDEIKYAMAWMQSQMICYGFLIPTAKHANLHVKWEFDPKQMQNCAPGYGKTAPNKLTFIAGKGKQNAGIAVVDRLVLSDACDSGEVSITTSQK